MIVNNEDYYYLPGVAKAIKDILGRDDLVKMDVPELLVQLGYDYDTNTIPYDTHGKTISLYKKSSIPELLNMPGNRYKANQIIARLSAKRTAQQKNINVFGVNRSRPRRSVVTEGLSTRRCLNEELKFDVSLNDIKPKRIVKIYRNINDPNIYIVYDGACYYNADCKAGVITVCIDQNTNNLINYVVKQLKKSYDKHNLNSDIKISNNRIKIKIDKRGQYYNSDVIDWLDDKGFGYDRTASYGEYLEFYLRRTTCDDMSYVLKSYEDCTELILKHAYQLSVDMLMINLDKISNHINNLHTVFQIGEVRDSGSCPPGIMVVGRLKQEYPDYVGRLESMDWDKKLTEQSIVGYGMLPGVYKCECKGKPCTMIVTDKKNGDFWTHGIVFYNDDNINVKDYL